MCTYTCYVVYVQEVLRAVGVGPQVQWLPDQSAVCQSKKIAVANSLPTNSAKIPLLPGLGN